MASEEQPVRASQWLKQNVHETDWGMLKMGVQMALENRKRINAEWCIVCGHAAVEDHSARFHAAGGCLAGPFCSERCAFHWLRDDRISDGEYPRDVVREVYREGTDNLEFERYSAAEKMASAMAGGQPVTIFPRGKA